MQKKFFTNLILVLVLNALVKPFYILGIDAEILKQVESTSPGAYGEYFSILGFTFILNIFLDLGITNYNTRNIAQNNHLLKKHFSGIITLRGLLSIGYMVLLVITGFFLGYDEHQFHLLYILGLNQILVSFILYFRSNLAGLLLFKQDSIVSIIDRTLLIIICSTLLWGGITEEVFKIEWFIYAQTFSYVITALIAGLLVLRKIKRFKITFNKSFSLMIIKQSMPYALLILLMMTYYRTDGVMLERMLENGKEEAAVYARGFRFFEAFNMIGYLFAGLLLPIFSKLLKQKENVADILFFSLKLILSFSILVGITSFFFQENIIQWRYHIEGETLSHSAQSFGMLMLCFIFMTVTYIFGTLLTSNGNLKALNITAGCGVVINILINYTLIPNYGAYGAGIASLITQGITSIIQVYLVFKIIPVHFNFKAFFSIVIFALGIIASIFLIQKIDMSWYKQFALILFLGGTIAFLTRMIHFRGILSLLKEK